MAKIVCRSGKSDKCYNGREETEVYEDSMADDGTFDGDSVVCDACYIAGGQPGIHVSQVRSRQDVIDAVNRGMGIE